MPELAFVISPRQNWSLREFAETLRYELNLQAVPSTLELDGFPAPRDGQVYVLVAPDDYLAVEGEGALPAREILERTILLCARPFEELERHGPDEWLRDAGAVFDMDPNSVALLQRAGIPARHLRPGYSKLRDGFDPEAERPLDVTFLGGHTLHRTKQLGRCAPVLARHNCLLHLDDPASPASIVGDAKWDLLRQTKVALNLHRGSDSYLEWLRVLDAIHAGAVVVSEQASGLAPLVPGEHLLVAAPESLPFVLEAALRDDERLTRMRHAAHERIRSVLPFASAVSVLRAVAVELVGHPIGAGAFRGVRTPALPEHPLALLPVSEPEALATRRAFREVSLGMLELRAEIARLEHVVRSGDVAAAPRREAETPAWSGHRPWVTIVTAVRNGAGVLAATLESVSKSLYRDFELVVVDDGSTDASSELVRDWMKVNPDVPTMLARHPIERGLGGARNTGLEAARASHCLILDAGDEIYPRCLEVLVGTLTAIGDVAFAYPMLEVVGNVDEFAGAGGDYLLNAFTWDVGRLMRSTRVESLAMIRTDRLRELGGFAVEPELWRWEDYDLWCRIADRGWRGQLVPQILGRRHAHLASLPGASNLTAPAPALTLIERAPKLFAGQAALALGL